MNRTAPLVMALLAGGLMWIQAADPLSDAAALAARRDSEERYRRLAADVENVQETQSMILKRQDTLQQRLSSLAEEIRNLKESQNRSAGNLASRDDLRKCLEKLKEVDDKREADKRLILKEIGGLAKVPATPPVEKAPPRRAAESPEEMPFVYVVRKNDTLRDIVTAYNDYFQKKGQGKVTIEQVRKANPKLKSDRLITGQKIHIPVPPKDPN